jgi:hypothetical protein
MRCIRKTTRFSGRLIFTPANTQPANTLARFDNLDAANLALELILRSGVADVEISNWRRI